MLIFAGVDGTGPKDNAVYAKAFASSHVKTLYNTWPAATRSYTRGPEDSGLSTKDRANLAANFVRDQYHLCRTPNQQVGIFLAGYSRGGAAVIDACWTLKGWKIPVDVLILFDAVDRTHTITSADTIPDNVAACFHAVRDPYAFSRNWFSNCGRNSRPGTAYTEKMFFATHGALGGCPWANAGATGVIEESNAWVNTADAYLNPFSSRKVAGANNGRTGLTPALDAAMSKRVWTWMSNHVSAKKSAATSRVNAARKNVKYENVMTR